MGHVRPGHELFRRRVPHGCGCGSVRGVLRLGGAETLSQYRRGRRAPSRRWKRQGSANPGERDLVTYKRRGRLVNPSPTAWEELGTTLATLVEDQGLVLHDVRRRFVFDILI